MPRPKKPPPRSPEAKLILDYMQSHPVAAWPKEIVVAMMAARDTLIAMAQRGDERAKETVDMLARYYKAAPDAMVAYLAAKATTRRGKRPKVSDEELRNAWALLRKKKPKATASHLAKRLAVDGLGSFSPDYLRRRLKNLL